VTVTRRSRDYYSAAPLRPPIQVGAAETSTPYRGDQEPGTTIQAGAAAEGNNIENNKCYNNVNETDGLSHRVPPSAEGFKLAGLGSGRRAGASSPKSRAPASRLAPRGHRAVTGVVISGAFINFLLHNHSVIYKILIFFFRRSKRQRIFSLFYFAS